MKGNCCSTRTILTKRSPKNFNYRIFSNNRKIQALLRTGICSIRNLVKFSRDMVSKKSTFYSQNVNMT